ncbi:hypothetical protein [Streptomyces sp. DH41]|uniref:hypothetical protein n=1 Tax=Streptomyces sp. DH41 TaxID=3040125 RepID=UPI00244266A4|nr:hypothetical protein [Streptomyces sp. DH41]MDG9728631.1 hypothetical protein [Streptomyces sp. DH41]
MIRHHRARRPQCDLGVGKDTIRHDLAAIRRKGAAIAPELVATEPQEALWTTACFLVLDEPLLQARAVLRVGRASPNASRESATVTRAAIRIVAATVAEHRCPTRSRHTE